jgi:hypothetical protein
MCAAPCTSCFSWLYNQLSSLCGGGGTITIACHDMFNRINCCEKCNCFQSTNVTVHGNLTSIQQQSANRTEVAAARVLPLIIEQPNHVIPFIQPKYIVESDV